MKRAAGVRQISLGAAGILLGVFIVFPFLWAVSASLQTELAIFRRERLAGLGIHTYLISKFLFYGVITGLQGMILYAMILFGSPAFHPDTTIDTEEAKPDLSGVVPDDKLSEFVMQKPDVQQCADGLGQLALDSGSRDNVSCVVIDVAETA